MSIPKVRGAGLRANGPFWAHYIRGLVLDEVAVLRETVVERALPSFGAIDQEAEEASDAALERLGRRFDPDGDPADMYEAAQDTGIIYYQLRWSARQAVVNLFAVALHHFLEQKLLFLLRRELLPKDAENDPQYFKRRVVVDAFQAQGINIESFPEWPKLEELRLVANVVKHAEGASADELWELRPELFQPEIIRRDPSSPLAKVKTAVWAPMSGEDLFVDRADLVAYFDEAAAFLRRLADEMESLAASR